VLDIRRTLPALNSVTHVTVVLQVARHCRASPEIVRHDIETSGINRGMSIAAYHATIRLGMITSILAAVCAVVLASLGDVSMWSLAVSVAGIGAVASWLRSGQISRGERRPALVVVDHTTRRR